MNPTEFPQSSSAPDAGHCPSLRDDPDGIVPGNETTAFSLPLSFAVPRADLAEFGRLPDDVRSDVSLKLRLLQRVHLAKNKIAYCSSEAARMQRRGFSAKTLRNLYYAYASSGDWRALANKAKAPELSEREDSISEDFKSYAHDFLLRNQRGKSRERYRELLNQLTLWRRTGRKEHSIPGYDAPPADAAGCDHPAGWSYSQLMRIAKPTPFEAAAFNIGRGRAADFRPQVMTSRVGLKPGQIVFFDDQVHDVRVNFVGNRRKIQRPLELVCMDCFSACFIAHGFKPTVWNDATETRVMLRQEDMVWFAMHWLLNIGWREDTGTRVHCEHGTAAFPDWLREKITELTGGKVTFTAGGVDRRAAFPGMFEGPARGNFRIKAGLESSFNLVRNETAAMDEFPGQVGRNRDASPEEWEARQRHNEALLLAAQALPPELAQQLKYPFLEWNQFTNLALSIYDVIDRRTWHELEGWERAGLLVNEWRLTPDAPWLSMQKLLDLPEHNQRVAEGLLAADPVGLSRTRKLSPREVWSRHSSELTRAPGYWLALLLPKELGKARKVGKDHLFEFEDQEISPEPMRYLAEVEGDFLNPGTEFLTFVNPWRPEDGLFLCDARGRFIGTCRPWTTHSKADLDAIHRQCGAAMAIEKKLLEPVARAGAEQSRKRTEDARHNAATIGGHKQEIDDLASLASDAFRSNNKQTEE